MRTNWNFLFCFSFFSKGNFEEKKEVFPPFLAHATADWAETFLWQLQSNRGGYFFVWKNIVSAIFGRFYKICPEQKNTFFYRASSILALISERYNIFQRRKDTYLDLVQLATKKVSAQSVVVRGRKGEKTSGHF
jgi:hypothetical protein